MSLDIYPQVEIYVVSTLNGAGWWDISTDTLNYVLAEGGLDAIEIEHGNRGSSTDDLPAPSECRMRWDLTDGVLWPGNPESHVFGSLDVNTPLRVALRLIAHVFPGTVVDSWSAVGGYAVSNTGSGGSVLASDWQQTPAVGTHSVPVANAYRQTVLVGFSLEAVEQTIEFQLPFSNTTGAGVEPANLIFRYIDTVSHFILRVTVNADETISVKWLLVEVGVGEFDHTDTYTAPITNSGQWIKVKGNIEGNRFQAKVWDPDDPEPLDWVIDDAPFSDDRYLAPGSIGVRSGVVTGNTNAKPIVISYRNWTVRSLPFHGEISAIPMDTDVSAEQITTHITAAGTTRRLTQGDPPELSALRRAIPQQPGVQAYWALEEKSGAEQFGSALAGAPPMIPLHGTPGYAEFNELDASQPLPTGNQADWRGDVPDYTHTGQLQVSFIFDCPAVQADRAILARWYTNHPGAKFWQITYRSSGSGDLQLQAWNAEDVFVYEASTVGIGLNGTTQLISVSLEDSGGNVDWDVRALNTETGSSGTIGSGTATGLQLASCKSVWINPALLDTPAFGHVIVQSVNTDFFELGDECDAWNFELTEGVRLSRLLTENGYNATRGRAFFAEEIPMGPQEPGTTPALLAECVAVGNGGRWFDGRAHDGIMYYHRSALVNQDTWFTLSLAGEQLQHPWVPVIDDEIRNRVTVKRKNGAEATYELASGRKSVLPKDEGGVGPYEKDVTVNAYDDSLLQQMAAWRVGLYTAAGPRFPAAMVELAAPAVLADPTIANRLLDLRPGRVFAVEDADKVKQFGPARLVVAGYTMRLSSNNCSYGLIGEPAGPWTVWELEHATRGRLDTASATLHTAVNAVATELVLDSPAAVWTTDPAWFPQLLELGGEVVECTDITSTLPGYIATGTAAHADNASVSPGIPAGATGAGDDMLMITQGRGSRQASLPAGWDPVDAFGGIRLFRKTHSGAESPPTVSWSTGSAGDTNSAVITSWSDLGDLIASATASGGGVQNISIAEVTGDIPDGVVITVGVKADDWTSVATRTGATEIVDAPTTTGNDQGIVADYVLHNGSSTGLPSVTRPASEFVVTGGATSGYGSIAMVFGNRQVATVGRSYYNVSKPHQAGTAIRIYDPPHYAL